MKSRSEIMVFKIIDKLIYFFALSLLIFSPFPIGSVEPWAIFVLQTQAFLLFLAWLLYSFQDSSQYNISIKNLLPLLLFLALCLLQIVPLPESILGVLSDKRLGIWRESNSLLASLGFSSLKNTVTISLYPNATWRETLLLLSYIAFGFVISKKFTTENKIRTLLYPLLAVSIFQAAYGIYQYLLDIRNSAYPDLISATGSFVNRNHFAGYLEMSIPIALGYALSLGAWQDSKRRSLFRTWISSDHLYKQALLLFLVGIMLLALILSKSRMGIISAMLSLAFFFVTYYGLKRDKIKIGWMLVFVVAVALLYGLWIGLYPVFERFLQIEGDAPGRILVWKDSLNAIKDFPLLGTGFGTFSYVYPLYKNSMEQAFVYSYAHNDYLQLMVETGLIGFALLITALLLLIFNSLRSLKGFSEQGDYSRFFLGLGALTGIISILIHSLADFNLHIPANALYFAFLIGLLAAVCDRNPSVEVIERVRVKRKRRRRIDYYGGELNTST
jgi:O-antigen ligase